MQKVAGLFGFSPVANRLIGMLFATFAGAAPG
jgi:hypothetical protein